MNLNIDSSQNVAKPKLDLQDVPEGVSQKDIPQEGVSQKDIPQEGVSQKDIPQEEDLEEKANAEELENLIEQLNQELESLKKELLIWQEPINQIYEETKSNPEIKKSELDPEQRKQIDEYNAMYIEYDNVIKEINAAKAKAEGEKGLFTIFVLDPLKKSLDKALKGVKNGTASALTGTFTFWTDVAAESMEKMRKSLEKIQEVKAKIAAAGENAKKKAMAGAELTSAGAELTSAGAELTTAGLPDTTAGLSTIKVGGGRYSNIKEVQKGGAAAAKRAQDSIKQFLSSSVTSSHILNMVKRKTKAKRKRNEKRSRYSRKRARK